MALEQWMFVSWFLIVFAGVESRNISDVAGDDEVDRTTVASILGSTLTKYLVLTLKIFALLIIYTLGGLLPTLLTVFYLLYLRFFRRVTQKSPHYESTRLIIKSVVTITNHRLSRELSLLPSNICPNLF